MKRLTDKERKLRLKIGKDQDPLHVVAKRYGVSENHVRWCRRLALEAGERPRRLKGFQPVTDEQTNLRLKIGTMPGTRKEVAEQFNVPIKFVKQCRNLAVKAGLRQSPGFSKPKGVYRDSMRFASVDSAVAATPKATRRGISDAARNHHKYKGYYWRWVGDVNSGLA
jgi:hypothetical protein